MDVAQLGCFFISFLKVGFLFRQLRGVASPHGKGMASVTFYVEFKVATGGGARRNLLFFFFFLQDIFYIIDGYSSEIS